MNGVKRIFSKFNIFSSRTTLGNATAMYQNCKQQIENKHWHTRGLIGTDFRSKQALLMVHVWMVHKRLLLEGSEGEHVQECLFDELWEDTTARIRSHGINVISINKYLKEVQGYSFRCCLELDQALAKEKINLAALEHPDGQNIDAADLEEIKKVSSVSVGKGEEEEEEVRPTTRAAVEQALLEDIGGVLWRIVYNRKEHIDPAHIMMMAKYVRDEQKSLGNISMDALNGGRIAWGPLPAWKRSSSNKNKVGGGKKEQPVVSADIDDEKEDEWKEALTPDGKKYYWNIKTKQTTWDKPEGFNPI